MNCIRIWSCDLSVELPELPKVSGYEISSQGFVNVRPEDIPAGLYLTLPGICACMTLDAEPKPDSTAMVSLTKFASRAASAVNGAYEIITDDAGGSRYVYSGCTNDLYRRCPDRMYLSLWFAPANGTEENRMLMLEAIEKIMPFALPDAYGNTNPPENKYFNEKRSEFTGFLEKSETPVWFCRRPLGQLIIRDRVGTVPGRSGYISLEMPVFLNEIPEWHAALVRLMTRLSEIYSAFFAQLICEERGVVSWWWRGIPYSLGCACIVGKEYAEKIDDCSMGTVLENGAVLFEEPNGPVIDRKLLSKKKSGLLSLGRSRNPGEDYTLAEIIPETCYRR